jgi:NADPH2:quinone reductase
VAPGDRVIAFSGVGAFAEMCLASKDKVVPMPEGMSFDAAAAFGITYATAIHAFQDSVRLLPNDTVLVLGAAGGVGIAAIEVAKAMGAYVIAAAATDEKLALCRQKGANATINYSLENLRARTLELTDGKGVDVVFDPVGGDYTMDAFRATAWGGRLLWSVLPPAIFPRSRSITRCSANAPSSVSSGAPGRPAMPRGNAET